LRKFLTAVMAVPILLVVYGATLRHRPRALRAAVGVSVAVLALVAVFAFMPRSTSAVPASTHAPLAAPIRAGRGSRGRLSGPRSSPSHGRNPARLR
jgi:hypothetical protein